MGSGSSLNRLSRPTRVLRTMRARCSTRRCLVTACRVSREPAVRWAMDADCPELSRATSASRVLSPNAAKSTACAGRLDGARLGFFRDISLDILHLLCPAAVVSAQGVGAPFGRNSFETRLGEQQ